MGDHAEDAIHDMVDFFTRKDDFFDHDEEDDYPPIGERRRRGSFLPKPTSAAFDFADVGDESPAGLARKAEEEAKKQRLARNRRENVRQTKREIDYGSPDYEKALSITELAECVKDLVRIIKLERNREGRGEQQDPMDRRLDDIYKKASNAKNRMDT